jgi:hypothetical protein
VTRLHTSRNISNRAIKYGKHSCKNRFSVLALTRIVFVVAVGSNTHDDTVEDRTATSINKPRQRATRRSGSVLRTEHRRRWGCIFGFRPARVLLLYFLSIHQLLLVIKGTVRPLTALRRGPGKRRSALINKYENKYSIYELNSFRLDFPQGPSLLLGFPLSGIARRVESALGLPPLAPASSGHRSEAHEIFRFFVFQRENADAAGHGARFRQSSPFLETCPRLQAGLYHQLIISMDLDKRQL